MQFALSAGMGSPQTLRAIFDHAPAPTNPVAPPTTKPWARPWAKPKPPKPQEEL